MLYPPQMKSHAGKERQIGVEIEYAGVPLEQACTVIQELYGGEIQKSHDARFHVRETRYGDFRIEVDALTLQKIVEFSAHLGAGRDDGLPEILRDMAAQAGKAIGHAGAKIAPLEVIAPPIPISQLPDLDELREKLHALGAKDTHENFYYAFGLHLNPEIPELTAEVMLAYLQAFLLLYPWLVKAHQVDFARRVAPFIDPFPKEYLHWVLNPDYAPDFEQLVRDYHRYNPTRNRALDMLPLFAEKDKPLVRSLYGEEEKINSRPAFHYRLPNCEISDPRWSLMKEWDRWVMVEYVAEDTATLHQLIRVWQQTQLNWISMESDWVEEVDHILGRYAR